MALQYPTIGGLQYGEPAPVAPANPVGNAPRAPLPNSQVRTSPYDGLFQDAEKRYNLPPGMLKAVAEKESSYRPTILGEPITNPKSRHYGHRAQGMFQFMPNTWAGEGHVGDPLNPQDATEAAAKKLSRALQKRGTIGGALADYYGRGLAPSGHPTTNQYAQDIVDRMNLFNSGQSSGQPQRQAPPQGQFQQGTYAKDTRGDFFRGAGHGFSTVPQALYGLAAGAGATGESIFGKGGMSTSLKEAGLAGFKRYQEQQWRSSKQTDDLDFSLKRAVQDGDIGSLIDWTQHALGYGGANLLIMLATFGAGGVAARAGAQGAVKTIMSKAVTNEAKKIAKGAVTEEVTKQAVRNLATRMGQYGAVGAAGFGMEAGEIGGGLAEKTVSEDRVLTGEEIRRGLGSAAAAGSLEFLGNILGIKAVVGKGGIVNQVLKAPGIGGKLGRAGMLGAPLAAVEAGTEGAQTYIEEYGIGNPINAQTHRGAFNAAGIGGVAGFGAGAFGGMLSNPQIAPTQPPPAGPPPAGNQFTQVETDPAKMEEQERADIAEYYNQQEQADLTPQQTRTTPKINMPVSDIVDKMMTTIFPAKRAGKMTKDYMAALAGDITARERVVEALHNQENPTKEVHAMAAESAIADLTQQLKEERADPLTVIETQKPGETRDMFSGRSSVPVTNAWDLYKSDRESGVSNEEFPIRMNQLEWQHRDALARGDVLAAREIADIAMDELSGAFYNGSIEGGGDGQVAAMEQLVRDKVFSEYAEYRERAEKLATQMDKVKEDKKPAIRRKLIQLNTEWENREQDLQDQYFRVSKNTNTPRKLKLRKGVKNQPVLPLRFKPQPKGGSDASTNQQTGTITEQGQGQRAKVGQNQQQKTNPTARLLKSILRMVPEHASTATVAQVEEWIEPHQGEGIVRVNVVRSIEAVPEDILLRLTPDEKASARGLWDEHTDEIYLIANRLYDREQAIFVMMHEAAHRGLKEVFGENLGNILNQIYAENPRVKAQADTRMAQEDLTKDEAIEEVLADMAMDNRAVSLKGWGKLVEAIRNWLNKTFGKIFSDGMTDEHVQLIVSAATQTGLTNFVKQLEVAMQLHELKAVDSGLGRVEITQNKIRQQLADRGHSEKEIERKLKNYMERAQERIALDRINDGVTLDKEIDIQLTPHEFLAVTDGIVDEAIEEYKENSRTPSEELKLNVSRDGKMHLRAADFAQWDNFFMWVASTPWVRTELPSRFSNGEFRSDMHSQLQPGEKKVKLSTVPTYDRVRDILTDKEGKIAERIGTSFPDMVMRNFATLGQLVDVIKKVLPAAQDFDSEIRKMQAATNDTVNKAAPIATRWGGLNEQDLKTLEEFITETEQMGMRPDVPRGFDDFANLEGRSRFENRAQAAAKYQELKIKWNSMSPNLQKLYTEQANLSTEMIRSVIDGIIKNIRDNIPDSATRKEMIGEIKKRWKHALHGRPYIPHKRFGKYVVIAEVEGERSVFGFETEKQANAHEEMLKEKFANKKHDIKTIMGVDVHKNLDGADASLINKIQQAVVKNVDDPETAQKLSLAVQEIYVAALPEMSGAKRLMTRKNIPGWSTEYRRSWSEAVMSMSRYSAKLHHMDSLRDTVEDAGRQAGKDKSIYAITFWDLKKKDLQTQFRNNAIHKTRFTDSLGPNIEYDLATASPDKILAQVKHTYVQMMGKEAGEKAFEVVEKQFDKNEKDTKVDTPHSNRIKSSRYFNLLRHRYSSFLEHKPRGPISNFLVNLGFVNYLGWTPAFAFMNATQVAMLTMPRLAARYGAGPAAKAIGNGYGFALANKEVFAKLSAGAWGRSGLDSLQIKDFHEADGSKLSSVHKDVLDHLLKHGKLDFTQGSELNEITENTPEWAQRVVKSSSWLAHPTEVLNRVVTALATYELSYKNATPAKSKEFRHKQAIQEAVEVLDTTQYDYSPENRPLILQHPTARVMLQFRQFSQQTAWQIGKAVKQALNKQDSKTRKEQRAYLLYILASTLTLAGVRGLPAAGFVLMIASMLGDEGDDLEFELQRGAREILGDTFGPMLTDGIFAGIGIDASRNIGLGDIIPGTNTSNRATTGGKDKLRNTVFDAMGPLAAWGGNVMNGIDTMNKGDTWRGIEETLPKAFRTPMKAYRLANRGMETKGGIVRIKDTDITPWEIVVIGAGLKPEKIGWVQSQVGYIQNKEAAIRMQSQILRKRMQFAIKYGDKAEERDVKARMNEFNKQYPDFRITAQSYRPPLKNQRRADSTGGVANTKGQVNLYRLIMNDDNDDDDFF